MLQSLRITNFILIDDCRIEFDPGLNVLTGETGAGKSMIVDALSLLLGERSTSDSIRNSNHEATIEAVFELAPTHPSSQEIEILLDEFGLPIDENFLIVTRRISAEGRSRTFINQSQCLLKSLKEIGDRLVDLHGQHEHQSLLNKSSYRPLLDRFGNYEKTLHDYQNTYNEWKSTRENLVQLEENARERMRQLDMLKHQRNEIDEAVLQPGEDKQLDEKLNVLQHAERLSERCSEILFLLCESNEQTPVLDQLEHIESELGDMAAKDTSLDALLQSFQSATITLKEISRELQSYATRLEYDPDELERMQERRFHIQDLKKKYGGSIEEILSFRDSIHGQITRMENFEEEKDVLQKQEEMLRGKLIELGQSLHSKRETTAKQIAQQVTAELKHLHMEQAKFQIVVREREAQDGIAVGSKHLQFGPNGYDDIEFLITTIPDKPPRPLREVASGGEISRIMLALKCALGTADPVPTMIFDEIDVGVGGKTADAVGERLAAITKQKQILCITHLPQIASRAHCNLRVEKQTKEGQLYTHVSVLGKKEREQELARMLGGEDSAASKKFAREMLKASSR